MGDFLTSWVAPSVPPAILGTLGVVVVALVNRLGKRGEPENLLIDQLQEDRASDRARLDQLAERIDLLEREVHRLLGRDQLWQVHAERLEGQVEQLGGTPCPRPKGLSDD